MSGEVWLGIAGLVVSISGFAIAVWQIVLARRKAEKAATVAEETKKAVDRTQQLAAINDLLLVIPDMQRLERQLQKASADRDGEQLVERLSDWRGLAPQAAGLFEGVQTPGSADLRSRLHESATVAAQAISDSSEEDADVRATTKRALTIISGATEQAGVLLGQLRAYPGGKTE